VDFALRLSLLAASITDADIGGLDSARPIPHLKERLATMNLGLVSVADPAGFSWPGSWIAIVEVSAGTREPVAMFGVPSGPLDAEGARLVASGRIVEGYVIAPLHLSLPHGPGAYGEAGASGVVVGIYTAPDAEADCVAHDACRITRVGLDGDRYASGAGTFSSPQRGGEAVTLIAEEAISEAQARGATIDAATARRNIVTRGIDLDPLIGHRFALGGVVLEAVRRAEPCAHLERLTEPGVLRGMVHLGGIRADVVTEGDVRIGDDIRLAPTIDEETP